MQNIRNFCIIAHIDHGKSTLADRLLQHTGSINDRDFQNQILDDMDLEREKGITIKSHAIQMNYKHKDNDYILNLIDTPGHVDFSYEVSRSIAACEGALLVVDATQGIQAQTISNLYLAIENDLDIIPVLNKMDMPAAMPDEVKEQIIDLIGCPESDILAISAKTGEGIEQVFDAIIDRIRPPKGDVNAPLQALIFDSVFNSFRGIIAYFRIFNGQIKTNDFVKFVSTQKEYHADEIGVLRLTQEPRKLLQAGDVGYIISGIKNAKEVSVGDTITHVERPCNEAIEGFKEVKSMVFAGIYPVDADDYEELRSSLEKLQLNDASLTFEPESSLALGFGFRCGFLGLLHLEVIQERLEREFDQSVIFTAPSVKYRVQIKGSDETLIDNPMDYPDEGRIDSAQEPYIRASVITPTEYLGNIMTLCMEKRGVQTNMTYLDEKRVEIIYDMPLSEVLFDFYDRLKSISRGYASFDYDITDYKPTELVKLDILLNGKPVDALSQLVFKGNAYDRARKVCERLRDEIPRQQFKIPIQGSIGSHVIARETVNALRKDVLAKCYGGDITRKRKLLEKQKEGKKRMKMVGDVELPQSAFLAVLKSRDE
jgi:GTP-binding protein LepA